MLVDYTLSNGLLLTLLIPNLFFTLLNVFLFFQSQFSMSGVRKVPLIS